ncbi:MAG: tRNA pseudouridine(38-40) synthase TruA [Peptococcaceae bacterium]|jgi:tRNA pseudouridine38-40 synthase|nr:tRNA pseudouridine(38-40) synthase TruA [Peptococcaceae bacterium]MDH7526139.1 tRNA pseudouridine(38-40) synthase TruA [Peptococcaceae bacterium]
MRNVKMTVAYDGTNYHGFQVQNRTGLKTVQNELESVLHTLTGEKVRVIGSGRTDAGVHARGQVINFFSSTKIPPDRFPLAMNSLLPRDIVVWEAQDVSPGFHARFSAKNKTYRYAIYNYRHLSPFWRLYAYHVPVPLDKEKMSLAAGYFLGTHDFSAFCAQDARVANHVRTIFEFMVEQKGPLIFLTVTADGFLYNMVRIMAGTLLEIGMNKRQPESVPLLLQSGERKQAGMTLPPQGLCLMKVEY